MFYSEKHVPEVKNQENKKFPAYITQKVQPIKEQMKLKEKRKRKRKKRINYPSKKKQKAKTKLFIIPLILAAILISKSM